MERSQKFFFVYLPPSAPLQSSLLHSCRQSQSPHLHFLPQVFSPQDMASVYQKLFAECIGTAALVFVGCGKLKKERKKTFVNLTCFTF